MASIENRSRFVVRVPRRPQHDRDFPYYARAAALEYVAALEKQHRMTAELTQLENRLLVRIRLKGHPPQHLKADSYDPAEQLILKFEADSRRGLFIDYSRGRSVTFAQLVEKYLEEECQHHKGEGDAHRRRDAYVSSLDTSLKQREDRIAETMRSTNASAISKIRKIYVLVDELGSAAKDFVACKNGCAACCHMNVMISALEAKHIEAATGKPRMALSESRTHDLAEFSGRPCPFLKDSSCSIYDVRPFACRKHVCFDTTNYWCQPERSNETQLPMIRFEGAEEAFFSMTGKTTHGVFGDIRDFFPHHSVKT